MPTAQVKIVANYGDEPTVCMVVDLQPRGSGNRRHVVALERAFREHPDLGPHIVRTDARSSRLKVFFECTPGAAAAVMRVHFGAKMNAQDVASGQLRFA